MWDLSWRRALTSTRGLWDACFQHQASTSSTVLLCSHSVGCVHSGEEDQMEDGTWWQENCLSLMPQTDTEGTTGLLWDTEYWELLLMIIWHSTLWVLILRNANMKLRIPPGFWSSLSSRTSYPVVSEPSEHPYLSMYTGTAIEHSRPYPPSWSFSPTLNIT